jgi:hypothetical protein
MSMLLLVSANVRVKLLRANAPLPQPDYSVGFGRSAFTDDQLEKLKPFVGEIIDTFTSYFIATWQMYLPFLTCEVKCVLRH